MDRRQFLKLTSAGAAVPTVCSAGADSGPASLRQVPTTCDMCVNKCSILATVEGGRVKKLDPNPRNPRSRGMVCARGNAGIQQLYDPDRLKHPWIRAGARGEGKWKKATWSEALDFAAGKLDEVKKKHGPQGVLWSSSEGLQELFFNNLALSFGSPNTVRHTTLCLASVNLAYSVTFGTVPAFDLLNARYIIMSGANRLEAFMTPDTMDLVEAVRGRKAHLVYLDPRFTVTAAKASEWHPIQPGTDLAFLLAMIHVIVSEKRYNGEFVSTRCTGFDQLAEHVRPYTPEWAEKETSIPAADVARIARDFADAAPRAVYYAGRRSSWYTDDFQMRRAQAILNAIVGNWDQEGGMVPNASIPLGEHLFLPWDDPTAPRVDEMDKHYPLAAKDDGAYVKARENILAGSPYAVKGWMVYKQDPVNSLPDQALTLKMASQMDFIGVIDIQMSDTAWYADVVFPESTYLERQDPLQSLPGLYPVVVFRQPVVPPLYDTRPMLEIAQGLAGRLDLKQYFDFTIDQWITAQASELPVENALAYLKTHGTWSPASPPRYGSTLNAQQRFVTKSGKIEIFSERLAEAGHDPLPVYRPPAAAPNGRLRVILGREPYFTHASTSNNRWLNTLSPGNQAWIHPGTAAAAKLKDGDEAILTSKVGKMRVTLRVAPLIRPECIYVQHGFGKLAKWQSLAAGENGSDAALLESATDKVSGNAALHETFVAITKA